jgi:hypothetical protein
MVLTKQFSVDISDRSEGKATSENCSPRIVFLGHGCLIEEAEHLPWTDDETVLRLVVMDNMIGQAS